VEPTPAPRPAAPSAELLEFLGEFSDDEREWIDPAAADDDALPRAADD